MADKLPNPLNSGGGSSNNSSSSSSMDFLAFSTTSTPREEKFKPRRGKQNRQDNWNRFGQFERGGNRPRFSSPQPNRGSHNNSPHFNSTPNWTQGPSQRGWRGSPNTFRNFTPRGGGGSGGGRGFTPRDRGGSGGGGRGGRGNFSNDSGSYFHPSMIEDPWADLIRQRDRNAHIDSELNADTSLSDSLRPQVGDSIINPAPDVPDSLDHTLEDMSKYSFSSDKDNAGTGENPSDITLNESGNSDKIALSDSLIPMVGDSILERNKDV